MRKVEHRLRLDLLRGGNQGYIRVKRGENGARRLAIALYMHSVPYMADAGTTAVFRAIKPDNTQLFNSATITDNVVTVGLTTQTVAALGTVRCELSIYGMNNELLYSPQFDIVVEDNLYDDGAIESTNEYTELTQTLASIRASQAEIDAITQQMGSWETAEAARAEAEESRATLYAEWNGLTVEAQDGDAADAELNDVSGHKNILFTLPRGKGFTVLGQFMTLEALQSAVTTPKGGDAYGVGSTAPYDIYIWDKVENKWKNHGKLQGPQGNSGAAAGFGTPAASASKLAAGAQATVAVTASGPDTAKVFTFEFGIPQGEPGGTGPAGPNEITADTTCSISGLLKGSGGNVAQAIAGADYATPNNVSTAVANHNNSDSAHSELFVWKQDAPAFATALSASGTALTANTLYNVSAAVGTYSFTAPATGWAHGIFITGTTPNITFTGKIIGKLPTFAASKQYEFDVLDGAWVVQEVLTQ